MSDFGLFLVVYALVMPLAFEAILKLFSSRDRNRGC